jgi:acetyl-CoA acetyltransferase
MSNLHKDIGIIGFGSAHYDKKPQQSLFGYMGEAARNALASAGVRPQEVDGLAADMTATPDTAVTMAEYFGLSIGWSHTGSSGGTGALMSVARAIQAVESGHAKYVLCIGAGAQDIAAFKQRASRFNTAIMDYLMPHGFGGMPGIFAIIQRKHMETYGTTREQLGRISVDLRANARMNESALLRGPLTLKDYLDAPPIAEPLGLYDCVMPCSGAEAVLVGPLDRVPPKQGVRMLAVRERNNYTPGQIAPLSGGWEAFREDLYSQAERAPADMDFVQLYEDLGFCKKGEIGHFLERNQLTYNGSFPVNTGGGQLSCGQAGGAAGLLSVVEAVRQLKGQGKYRQVANASCGIVSGFGMISYGQGLAAAAAILEQS